MSQPLWKKLATVAELDHRIKQLTGDLATLEQGQENLTHQLSDLESHLNESVTHKRDLQKKIDALELHLSDINNKEKQKKEAIASAEFEKEYKALAKELAGLERLRQDQEDALVSAWHEFEQLEKHITLDKSELFVEKEKLDAEMQSLTQKIVEFNLQKNELAMQREAALVEIPTPWKERYESMKNKVQDPIVPIANTSCSSCYYHVLPQDLLAAKKHAIIYCQSCYRLLYFDSSQTQSSKSTY